MHPVAAVAASLLLLTMTACSKPGDNPDEKAMTNCRDAVTKQLKNPTTAEFVESSMKTSTWQGDKGYGGVRIDGRVASENQLGGTVTLDFICVTSPDGSGAMARLREPA